MSSKPLRFALKLKCPRCGSAKIYSGFLKIIDKCPECGLNIKNHDAADGPAYTAVLLMGPLAVMVAILVEVLFEPALWLHIAIIVPFVTVGSVMLLVFLKPLYIALHYKINPGDYKDDNWKKRS